MSMRPTFLGFETCKSSIFSSQKSLDITGNNLANVSTEGYTRQRVVQSSVSYVYPSITGYSKPAVVANLGAGVRVDGVQQVRDESIDRSYRSLTDDAAYYEQRSDMLTDIETVLQELDEGDDGTGYGLINSIKELYTALEDYSGNVSSVVDANVVKMAFQGVAENLTRLYKGLENSRNLYKDDLQLDIDDINTNIADIAVLNKSIKEAIIANGYSEQFSPNELLDKRNVLLDKLSKVAEISVKDNADGTVDVTLNGHMVVEDEKTDYLVYQENSNNTVSVVFNSDGSPLGGQSGSIKAYTDIINGAGTSANSPSQSIENGYLYYMSKLDTFASVMANVFNNIIPDTMDSDGNITSYKKIFVSKVDDGNGGLKNVETNCTALSISISDELNADSKYLIFDENSTNNKYVLNAIAALKNDDQIFKMPGESFKGTFDEYVIEYIGTLGSDIAYQNTRSDAIETVISQVLDTRDSISGVSESEETVNMLTFNRAFQAASKMLNTMDGLLDIVINRMGVS